MAYVTESRCNFWRRMQVGWEALLLCGILTGFLWLSSAIGRTREDAAKAGAERTSVMKRLDRLQATVDRIHDAVVERREK